MWFIVADDNSIGPFQGKLLKEIAASGRLSREDLVHQKGQDKRLKARKIQGLFDSSANENRPTTPPLARSTGSTPIVQISKPAPNAGRRAGEKTSSDVDTAAVLIAVLGMLCAQFATAAILTGVLHQFAPVLALAAIPLVCLGLVLALVRRHASYVLYYWALAFCVVGISTLFVSRVRADAETLAEANAAWDRDDQAAAVKTYEVLIGRGHFVSREERIEICGKLIDHYAGKGNMRKASELVNYAVTTDLDVNLVNKMALELLAQILARPDPRLMAGQTEAVEALQPSESRLTLSNFEQIENGMAIDDVETILGRGTEQSSSGVAGITAKAYIWQDGFKVITVMFLNDRVNGKAQVGLESATDFGSDVAESTRHTPKTIFAADEEFRIAASHHGDRGNVAARLLIEGRNYQKWSWDLIEGQVEFQFGDLEKEVLQWKKDRIAAGDRYE